MEGVKKERERGREKKKTSHIKLETVIRSPSNFVFSKQKPSFCFTNALSLPVISIEHYKCCQVNKS